MSLVIHELALWGKASFLSEFKLHVFSVIAKTRSSFLWKKQLFKVPCHPQHLRICMSVSLVSASTPSRCSVRSRSMTSNHVVPL